PLTVTDEATTESDRDPAASLVKEVSEVVDVNDNDLTDTGDEIWYRFTITNDGNVTLTDPVVTDPMLAAAGVTVSCPTGPVAPGRSVTCAAEAPYVVTLADTNGGEIVNTATASVTPPPGAPVPTIPPAEATTPTDQAPGLSVSKSVDATELVLDEELTYTITATNGGNVTLEDVSISDDEFTGSGSLSPLDCTPAAPAVLDPGEVMTCTATYRVTQDDVDLSVIENTASGSGVPPSGTPVTDEAAAPVPADVAPSSVLTKSVNETVDVNGNELLDAGDEIWYKFEFENTGNVTLTDPVVTDPMLAAAGIGVDCPTRIPPGESV